MKFQTVSVTPEQAKAWLKTNTLNRPIRPTYIKSLAACMKRGEWQTNHQALAVNGSKLLDGQHRLMAFLESGLPKLQMAVITEVPTETFDTIDIGIKRTHADIFREDKFVMNPISVIGRLAFGRQITPHELVPVYEKLKRPMREVVDAIPRPTKAFGASGIRVGILAAIFNGEDKKRCLNMYSKMASFQLDGLPRIAQLFVKQVALNTGQGKQVEGTQRDQLIVRSFTTFQAANSDLAILKVHKVENRMAQVRQIFKDSLGMK